MTLDIAITNKAVNLASWFCFDYRQPLLFLSSVVIMNNPSIDLFLIAIDSSSPNQSGTGFNSHNEQSIYRFVSNSSRLFFT